MIVTQLKKCLDKQQQLTSFKLFLEMMNYLENSIHSVMKLYIPSAELPVLHVACPLCDDGTPHVMLDGAAKISPALPSLCCAVKGATKVLPRSSYLPFGDSLTQQDFSKLMHVPTYVRSFVHQRLK